MNRRYGRFTHAEERRDAGTLNLKDVVIWTDREVLTGESERHIGQLISLRALDAVLTIEALLCTNLFVAILGQYLHKDGKASLLTEAQPMWMEGQLEKFQCPG